MSSANMRRPTPRRRARRSRRRSRRFRPGRRGNIQERANILDRAGNEILARKDELGRLLSREEGKTLPEGVGEAARAGNIFKFFAGEALRLAGEKVPSVRPGVDVEITREPLGVIGLITPWNFPIAIPAWKIAPALAYGNTRRHEARRPRARLRVGDRRDPREGRIAGRRVQSRDGTRLGRRRGARHASGRRRHQLHRFGRDRAAASPRRRSRGWRRVQLEMGGKNPLVDRSTTPISQRAVNCAVQGAYFSTGQRCTASSRLIVTDGIHDRFVAAVDGEAAPRSRSTMRSRRARTSVRSSTRASSTPT